MPPFLTAALPVPHGFFTRQGGVSSGRFASLNCSLSGRDDPDAVRENRARAAGALDLPPAALVGLTQVHGTEVATLREPWAEDARPKADAVVTDRPGLLLGIVTGDCAPVLFADAEAGVIGAAHAGWRGAVAGVLEATIAAMEALGAARGVSPPPSAPASPSRATRSGPTCATPCWRPIPAMPASSPLAGGRIAGSSTCPATAWRAWPEPVSPPAGSAATPWWRRTPSSVTAGRR